MHYSAPRQIALAAALLLDCGCACAADDASPATKAVTQAKLTMEDLGIHLWGYMRSGAYAGAEGEPTGQYQLAGALDHYRLGNEGDTYLEFGIGKLTDLGGGLKWGVYWMPTVYNGSSNNAQAYTELTGLDFAPGIKLWAGQRYHRIQDVHIIDNWLMQDGDNYGAGLDDVDVGLGKLNVAAYTEGNSANHNDNTNNGKRLNFQWHDIITNPGGKLTITGAATHGRFDIGSNGGALGLLHNQVLTTGVNNSLFLQGSQGHADLSGEFYGLDNAGQAVPGAQQRRIVDSIDWQAGLLGGQAVIGYQTVKPTRSDVTTRDFSTGGRLSYALTRHFKLLGELGYNHLSITHAPEQNLFKETVAMAIAPEATFWSRPEFRAYVTHANWNDAARDANAGSFGREGHTNATAYGLQVEAWW